MDSSFLRKMVHYVDKNFTSPGPYNSINKLVILFSMDGLGSCLFYAVFVWRAW